MNPHCEYYVNLKLKEKVLDRSVNFTVYMQIKYNLFLFLFIFKYDFE